MRKALGICVVGLALAEFCAGAAPLPVQKIALPDGRNVVARPDYLILHLPGISGRRWIDDQYALGLRDAGYMGDLHIYDWTGEDPGLGSLVAQKRNHAEAQKVADHITSLMRENPHLHLILSGHSGGTGIAIWALEKLPEDIKIDSLLLMASALSPDYDLSKALSHVRNKCYSFCSENDVLVLGAGTKMFGTIDGKKTEAAGEFGFVQPTSADAKQYAKLIQKPYDKSWMQYRNLGDHMGCMKREFVKVIVSPLVMPAARAAHAEKTQQSSQPQTGAGS